MKFHIGLVLVFAVCLGFSHYLGYTPIALAAFSLLASGVTYYLYAKDKAAAMAGSWRVPENTLHMASLLFGWPGALIAQERLRHKTKKQSFRTTFWLTVLVNLGGIAWLHSSQGNIQLHRGMYQLEHFVVSHVTHRTTVETALFFTRFRNKSAALQLNTIIGRGTTLQTIGEFINRHRND